MNSTRRVLLTLALLTAAFTGTAVATAIKCVAAAGCEVKIWNPSTQTWGPAEHVPTGTIVDTAYAIGWGAGWEAVP